MNRSLRNRLVLLGTRMLPSRLVYGIVRRLENYLQLMQGQGYGVSTVDTEVKAILPLLPETGAIVLDIGANKGAWCRSLLEQAGNRLERLYLFEPSAANWDGLRAIQDPRVRLVPSAVGETCTTSTLFSDEPGSGIASLYKRRLDHFGIRHESQEEVQVVTLDAFAETESLPTIDFMKMDIEGNELSALQGAKDLLSSKRIRAFSFEFGGTNIDSRTYMQDFWYLLEAYGYSLYRILPDATLFPITAYTEDLEVFKTTNYVASLMPVRGR